MALDFQENGMLVPGVHTISWDEFVLEYGYNLHRSNLISGLKMALDHLKSVGCKLVYIDGSFVTQKVDPGDFDACWEHAGVDLLKLKVTYPVFFDFANGRANQKSIYGGELMPAEAVAKLNPKTLYRDFFQFDKEDNRKGIIGLKL